MQGIPTPALQFMGISRTKSVSLGGLTVGVSAWATDPVGTTTVTFQGVTTGSEIRVYSPDGEIAGIENCAASQVLTWPVYASGSPNNTVRIVIIHPDYKIKEFEYVSLVGNQSIPVQQERDKWYSNPV